jgi:hypothetical protein
VRRGAALLAAAALAGCGDDGRSRAAYAGAVEAARAAFDRDVARMTAGLGATSTPARTQRALGDLGAAAGRFEDRLRAARPPEEVRPLHDRLVGEAARYRRTLAAARGRFARGGGDYLRARTALAREAGAARERVNAALAAVAREVGG